MKCRHGVTGGCAYCSREERERKKGKLRDALLIELTLVVERLSDELGPVGPNLSKMIDLRVKLEALTQKQGGG